MAIRILSSEVNNARGIVGSGDEVDWPVEDVQPLLDTGCAEAVVPEPEPEADPEPEAEPEPPIEDEEEAL